MARTGTVSTAVTTAAVSAAVLALMTGCGVSHAPAAAVSRATVSPPASPASALAAVIAAYTALWPAGQRADIAPAAQRQAILAPVATGAELTGMLSAIAADANADQVSWGQPVLHPYDVTVDGTTATLQDCQDETQTGMMNQVTGEKLTHGGPKVHFDATLDLGADGAWRVAELTLSSQPCLPAQQPVRP
jgi:hypothetical protein